MYLYEQKLSGLKFFRLARANFASVNAGLHYQTSEQREGGSQTSRSTSNFLNASLENQARQHKFLNSLAEPDLRLVFKHTMNAAAPRTVLEIGHVCVTSLKTVTPLDTPIDHTPGRTGPELLPTALKLKCRVALLPVLL